MIPRYEVYGRFEVYQALGSLPARDRQRILRFMERLGTDPFHEGDSSVQDSSGRRIQIKILGKYAVYYWPDHPAKEMRITDLIDVDRG